MPLSLVTAPTAETVSLEEAKLQVVQAIDDDDDLLANIVVPAAVERAEVATNRQLGLATWDLILDEFPSDSFIEMPKPPLVSVTYVHYVDMAGATQTWASSNYLVQSPAGPRCARGRIALPFSAVWPVTLPQMGAVTIRFVAGYTTVPSLLKAGMLMDIGTLYEHRESVLAGSGNFGAIELPMGSRSIYRSFKSHARQR